MKHEEKRLWVWPLDREGTEVLKYALLFTALLGLLAHGFAFFNLNPSHDSLFYFYAGNDSLREHIAFGRPLYFFYHILTGSRLVMPWGVGALALFWTGLAVFLTARLFELNGKVELLALAGVFVTNRTMTALTGTYIHDLGTYTFSLFLRGGRFYSGEHLPIPPGAASGSFCGALG